MNVLKGPDLHICVPEKGLGFYIFSNISKYNYEKPSGKVLIDAKSNKFVTYKELLWKSIHLAQAFTKAGYNENDTFAIYSENNLDFYVIVIACLYLGIVVVPINSAYSEHELNHSFDIVKPAIVFASRRGIAKMLSIKVQKKFIREIVMIGCDYENVDGNPKGLDGYIKNLIGIVEDINIYGFSPLKLNSKTHTASILFSSGTTGLPKGVMLSHENISIRIINDRDPLFNSSIDKRTESSVKLGFLPFFHAYGFISTLQNIANGRTTIIMSKFNERLFLQCIQDYKLKSIEVVPPIMLFLAKSPLIDDYDLSSLEIIHCGAAPLHEKTEILVKNRLKIDNVRQGYGLTECTHAVLRFPYPHNNEKVGSVGIVMPGMSAVIRDRGLDMGPYQWGELCLKGPMVMLGYKDDPRSTAESFTDDGWLLTGDIAYYDRDGYFYIVERRKELIKYKSFQVAPAELEAVLLQHPKIKDAAVIGVPDGDLGELPMGFIVKQSNVRLTVEEVHSFMKEKVSSVKLLRGGVKFVAFIPKTPSGKILRRYLRIIAQKNNNYTGNFSIRCKI